jgi:hypothetical protein
MQKSERAEVDMPDRTTTQKEQKMSRSQEEPKQKGKQFVFWVY